MHSRHFSAWLRFRANFAQMRFVFTGGGEGVHAIGFPFCKLQIPLLFSVLFLKIRYSSIHVA